MAEPQSCKRLPPAHSSHEREPPEPSPHTPGPVSLWICHGDSPTRRQLFPSALHVLVVPPLFFFLPPSCALVLWLLLCSWPAALFSTLLFATASCYTPSLHYTTHHVRDHPQRPPLGRWRRQRRRLAGQDHALRQKSVLRQLPA